MAAPTTVKHNARSQKKLVSSTAAKMSEASKESTQTIASLEDSSPTSPRLGKRIWAWRLAAAAVIILALGISGYSWVHYFGTPFAAAPARTSLEGKLTAIESSLQEVASQLKNLERKVDMLPQTQSMDTLIMGIRHQTKQITTLKAYLNDAIAPAFLTPQSDTPDQAVLEALSKAIETGVPYDTFLPKLAEQGYTLPPALWDNASSGIETLTNLKKTYPAAARRALEEIAKETIISDKVGVIQKANLLIQRLIGARAISPQEGNTPNAILSRAEYELVSGSIKAALAELNALPTAGQSAMMTWIDVAHRVQVVTDALAILSLPKEPKAEVEDTP